MSDKQVKRVYGIPCYVISEEEAEQKRQDLINDPSFHKGYDALVKLLGIKFTGNYVNKMMDNLKYVALDEPTHWEKCVCISRKKIDPNYICTGARCSERKNT